MTREEIVNRNIGLTFDFLRQVAKDPSILKNISSGSILEFVEKDFIHLEKEIKLSEDENKKYLIVKTHFELL
jgi:hypothetical protein